MLRPPRFTLLPYTTLFRSRVVGELELRQRRAGVAGGMVGVIRLDAGDGGADVGLRGRCVGAVLEAEVRGDRDRKQDPEDDDDDEELDQREAALLACDTMPQVVDHVAMSPSGFEQGPAVARPLSAP